MADGQGARLGARRARLHVPAPPPEGRRGVRKPRADAPSRSASSRTRRCELARSPATAAPARSSSSTSPTSAGSRSWRSTPACRSSTRSPRWSPAPTSSTCSCTSRPAAGSRAIRRRRAATRSRCASTPRTRAGLRARRPGRISLLRLPAGPGMRVDSGVAEGDTVPPQFDSMIAKIIAHGGTREQAIARLRRAVADTMVVIDDGTTNQGFLLELLGRDELRTRRGRHRLAGPAAGAGRGPDRCATPTPRWSRPRSRSCDDATAERAQRASTRFARRGRPEAERRGLPQRRPSLPRRPATASPSARSGRSATCSRSTALGSRPSVEQADRARAADPLRRPLVPHADRAAGRRPAGRGRRRAPPRLARRGRPDPQPRPGVVVAIPVSRRRRGQRRRRVAVTESMKMETSLTAPVRGRVREVLVSAEHARSGGQAAAADRAARGRAGCRRGRSASVRHPPIAADDPAQRRAAAAGPPGVARARLRRPAEGGAARPRQRAGRAGRPDGERACSRSTPTSARSTGRTPTAATRAPTRQPAGAPARVPALARRRAPRACPTASWRTSSARSRHYGIEGLERTAALEDAGYRLFLARQRAATARAAVRGDPRASPGDGDDQVVVRRRVPRGAGPARSRARHRASPALAELAREVRWRCCDAPADRAGARGGLRGRRRAPRRAGRGSVRADREAHARALVECAQPLAPLVFRRVGDAGPELRRELLEAMTKRYYRVRELEPDRAPRAGRRHAVRADVVRARRRSPPGRVRVRRARRALRCAARARGPRPELPEGEVLLADVYAWRSDDRAAQRQRAVRAAEGAP